MYAAHVKAQLKAAKDHIGAKRFQQAFDAADDALYYDNGSTTAMLYKAAAAQNLDMLDDARTTLEAAIKLSPTLVPAWQGLEKVYEKLGRTDDQAMVLTKLLDLYSEAKDGKRLGDVLAKLTAHYLAQKNVDDADAMQRLLLPGSRVHACLVDPPAPRTVWLQIAAMHRDHEQREIDAYVAQRKGLLGAAPEPELRATMAAALARTSCRIDAYRELLKMDDKDVDAWAAYLPILVTRIPGVAGAAAAAAAVTPGQPEPEDVTAELAWAVQHVVSHWIPVPLAYQQFLDTLDVGSVDEYPRDVLELYLNGPLAASSSTDRSEDEYAAAAAWILDPARSTPADLPTAFPSTPFSVLVTALLSDSPSESLSMASRVLARRSPASAPKATRAALLRKAIALEVFRRPREAQIALDTRSEVSVPDEEEEDDETRVLALLCQGNVAMQLEMYADARDAYAQVQDVSEWARSAGAFAQWRMVEMPSSGKDHESAATTATSSLATLQDVDAAQLASDDLRAVHLHRAGLLAYRVGDVEAAYTAQLAAARLSPSACPAAFTALGDIFRRDRGDSGRAAKCYAKALALDPRDLQAADGLVVHCVESSDMRTAAHVLVGITKERPRAKRMWMRLGLVRMQLGQWEVAATALQAATRIDGVAGWTDEDDANLWAALGEAYVEMGRWSAALKVLKRALELDPESRSTRYLLARTSLRLNHFDAAASFLDPDDYEPAVPLAGEVALAQALDAYNKGQFSECARLLQEGIDTVQRLCPPSDVDHPLAAVCAKQTVDLRVAMARVPHLQPDLTQHLESAVADADRYGLGPEGAIARYRLWQQTGGGSRSSNLLDKANHALRAALASTPAGAAQAPVYTALGVVAAARGKPRVAQHMLVAAMHADSAAAEPWTALGGVCLTQGDRDLAMLVFRRAAALDADVPDAWIGQAIAHGPATIDDMAALATGSKLHVTDPEVLAHAYNSCGYTSPLLSILFATEDTTVPSTLATSAVTVATPAEIVAAAIDKELAARRWAEWCPTDAAAWSTVGAACERAGNSVGAVDAYKRAARHARGDVDVVRALARALAGADPARAVELLARIPDRGGWIGELVLAFAQFQSTGVAEPATLAACAALLKKAASSGEMGSPSASSVEAGQLLLAQLMYQSRKHDDGGVPAAQAKELASLLTATSPGVLCALGMLTGNDALVADGFARASPTDTQYLTSVYQLLQGDRVAAHRALQRAAHMYPSDGPTWTRLARFAAQYLPTDEATGALSAVFARQLRAGSRSATDGSAAATAADVEEALGLATTAVIARGVEGGTAMRAAQRQILAHPSSARARQALGLAVMADTAPAHVLAGAATAAATLAPDDPLSMLLESAAALAGSTEDAPAVAMQHAERAVAAIVAAAGGSSDTVPPAVYRHIARVLWANGEADSALEMAKRAVDDSDADRWGRWTAWAELLAMYARVGWMPAAAALAPAVIDAAGGLEAVGPDADATMALLAAGCVAGGFVVPLAQAVAAAGRVRTGGLAGGSVAPGESLPPSEWREEQARGMLALALFASGTRARGVKSMVGVSRPDLVTAFEAMGGILASAV
ncbi:hypothetical protein BC828DRAFT_416110 [Blastocladiella britannica]|nr:hypothetical protein BC828DRAFT_416110 [Blastocladiella britannica]